MRNDAAKIKTDEFIKRAKNIHGNKYDYSQTVCNGIKSIVKIICPKHGVFTQRASDHLDGCGCRSCSCQATSYMEKEWLDKLNVPERHKRLAIGDSYIVVDGYDPNTNTVYEFWGDFWHGNPAIYESSKLNVRSKKTFGELYQKTLDKIEKIRSNGYNLVDIWETDWLKEKS